MKRTAATRLPRNVPAGQLRRTLEAVRRFRMHFVFGTLLLFFLLLLGRLAKLQVLENAYYVKLATNRQHATVTIAPLRGDILDRNGRVLATNRPVRAVYLDLHDGVIKKPRRFALRCSSLLGGEPSPAAIERLIANERFEAAQRGGSVNRHKLLRRGIDDPILVDRLDDFQQRTITSKMRLGLYGLKVIRQDRRQYPNSTYAAQVLGEMPLADHVQFEGDKRPALVGIEGRLDELLSGREVRIPVRKSSRNNFMTVGGVDRADTRGAHVRLTIDLVAQHHLETALDGILERIPLVDGEEDLLGVVLDPHTGEVLAMASRPVFDPNRRGYKRNHVIQAPYAIGSVFKPVTVAYALEKGVVTKDTELEMPPRYLFPDDVKAIGDSHPVGAGTVVKLLSESSNTGAAHLAFLLGPARMARLWERLRLGHATGIELPYDKKGLNGWGRRVPRPADSYRMAFGQGFSITQLKMASLFAAFARGDGRAIRPTILYRSNLRDPRGERVCHPRHLATVRRGLRECVETGTLASVFTDAIYPAAGKTGTSQFNDPIRVGGRWQRRAYNVCSVAAYAPAHAPELVVMITGKVRAQRDLSGASVSGRACRQVLDAVLDHFQVCPTEGAVARGRSAGRASEVGHADADRSGGQLLAPAHRSDEGGAR